MNMIDVKIAEYAGYCFGVKRALNLTQKSFNENAPKNRKVYTFGHIIHNPGVVKELEKNNIFATDDIDALNPGDVLIIRSHGVSPHVMEKIKNRGISIIDATCPFVKKAHKKARKLSINDYFVVLIGDKNHPEVIGIRDNIVGDRYRIVNSAHEAAEIMFQKKIGVVIQTTQTKQKFIAIISELLFKCEQLLVENTICATTEQRQKSTLEIAKEVDAMIIVGGKNSANTTHLAQIPKNEGYTTYHVENYKEIDPKWLKNVKSVGISGGASTPMSDIINIKKYIQSLNNIE
jgi:(E)-4-hydroxy-3-methyl-but-2-enyl pyrophosphate reductase